MTLVWIFGPPAVGKMTVGREVERLTGLPLLHNHMAIELALPFFEFGDPAFNRLVGNFRRQIFEEIAASDRAGLIFTYVWALDEDGDRRYVDGLTKFFTARGRDVCFVELAATLEERLRRNRMPSRLEAKASKQNVAESEKRLLKHEKQYRFNTDGDFLYPDRHLKVDNTRVAPEVVAERIVDHFSLPLMP